MEYETDYQPPSALDDMDEETIHRRMLSALPMDIDITPGGFAYDFTYPAALEKASMMMLINDVIQMFFPAWSFGIWLDQIAQPLGIVRRGAGYSQGFVTVKGAQGLIIPEGYLFATPNVLGEGNIEFAVTDAQSIGLDNAARLHVRCTQPGPVGNVSAGCVTIMVEPMAGIEHIVNPEPMTGGTPAESDASLRTRIAGRDLSMDVSFVGNVGDYKRWALEVIGVGSVVVVPEWQGAGTGSVKLIILDANGAPANQDILDDVFDHIMSPDDEGNRLAPVGANLTVETAVIQSIDVSATVELMPGIDLDAVKAEFIEMFSQYAAHAYAEQVVRITRLGSLLSHIAGVKDYENLTLNLLSANIPIDKGEYPRPGEITLAVMHP